MMALSRRADDTGGLGRCVEGGGCQTSKVDMEIFGLERPIVPEGNFNAGANRPPCTGAGGGAGGTRDFGRTR